MFLYGLSSSSKLTAMELLKYYRRILKNMGNTVGGLLRHRATSCKVAVSIPDGIIRIFHVHISSGLTVVLGLIQPLKEISTCKLSWGKDGRCVGLTTVPTSCADCLEIRDLQPLGAFRTCTGTALPLLKIWPQEIQLVCFWRQNHLLYV
jgi:hypothetical protein